MSLGDWIKEKTGRGVAGMNNAGAMPQKPAPQNIDMNELMQFAQQFMRDARYKGNPALMMQDMLKSGMINNNMIDYAAQKAMSNPFMQAFNNFSKMFSGIRGMFK